MIVAFLLTTLQWNTAGSIGACPCFQLYLRCAQGSVAHGEQVFMFSGNIVRQERHYRVRWSVLEKKQHERGRCCATGFSSLISLRSLLERLVDNLFLGGELCTGWYQSVWTDIVLLQLSHITNKSSWLFRGTQRKSAWQRSTFWGSCYVISPYPGFSTVRSVQFDGAFILT